MPTLSLSKQRAGQLTALVTGDPELLALSKQEPIEFLWIGA
jgi:hypothetical protein